MFEFDEKLFCHPHTEHGHFPPEKKRYTMTEEMEHTTREMRECIARLYDFEKRLGEKVEDIIKNITSDNVIFKNTFSESHRTFLEAVKNEINTFEGNTDSAIRLFMDGIKSDYATLSEDCAGQIQQYYNEFADTLATYRAELNETYDTFRDAIESRLEQHNSNYVQAFTDYTTSINSKITATEKKLSQDYSAFTNAINKSITDFKVAWTQQIDARLDGQDSVINDAVAYMKTNLSAGISNILASMKEDGSLDALIVAETKDIIGNKYFDINRVSSLVRTVSVNGSAYECWSDAIAQAINLCNETGMEIYFPAGTYYIDEPIVPNNGTVIKGATPSTSIIKVIPTSNINGINLINCVGSGFTVRDICISGDYNYDAKTLKSTSGDGVYISAGGECDNINFDNVVIEGFAEHGFHICSQSWVIRLSKCVLRRNKKYGLYLYEASDNMFDNLAIYQNGYGGIYTYLGGNNKYSNLKIYLNSRDCENSEVEEKYLAGISTNMTSLETFVNVEIQENFKHGFMIGGSSDYALRNILFDANGFENNANGNYRDLYIWGSRNIHGDIMLSAMKPNRGILDYRIFTSVNTKNIKLSYYKNDDADASGSLTGGMTHITNDGTTSNVSVVDGYTA